MIYHITTDEELRKGTAGGQYSPALLAQHGFVHCAREQAVLAVARDYFFEARGAILLLRINPQQLVAEVRYEDPAPLAEGGVAHLASDTTFPHVYGPIDVRAVTGIGALHRTDTGFAWPQSFVSWDQYHAGQAG